MDEIFENLEYEYSKSLLKLWKNEASDQESHNLFYAAKVFVELDNQFDIEREPVFVLFSNCDEFNPREILNDLSSDPYHVNYYWNENNEGKENEFGGTIKSIFVSPQNESIFSSGDNLWQFNHKLSIDDLYSWRFIADEALGSLEETDNGSSSTLQLKLLLFVARNLIRNLINQIILKGYFNRYRPRFIGKGIEGNIPFITWARPPTVSIFFGLFESCWIN